MEEIGSECGSVADNLKRRYSSILINGNIYKVHRVIYALKNNMDITSNMIIDHINGDISDNRIENLRLVSCSENALNKKCHRDLSENSIGVTWKYNGRNTWYWTVQWRDNFKVVVKYFNPKTIYPELPFEEAKQKTFELAKAFRDSVLDKGNTA